MAEPPSDPQPGQMGPANGPPRMPRWVKVFIVAGLLLLVAILAVLLLGGAKHGPWRHGG